MKCDSYEEDGLIGVFYTEKKKEDGLIKINERNIFLRILFREPELFVLRYKNNKEVTKNAKR